MQERHQQKQDICKHMLGLKIKGAWMIPNDRGIFLNIPDQIGA